MEKAVAKEIKEGKQKEKEEKWAKRVTKLGSATNQIAKKCAKKCVKTKFIATWTPIIIAEVGDHFHQEC
jgi:nucleosome binding factor SPN SPT16 subunit